MLKTSYSSLVQSRYYHPALNSAIFDGAVRIYFSQANESTALALYFGLQQSAAIELTAAKSFLKENSQNYLIIIYPHAEAFQTVVPAEFQGADSYEGALARDYVLALHPPFDEESLKRIQFRLKNILGSVNVNHATSA